MKITFDHSNESISGGLGISKERREKLEQIVFDHVEKSFLEEEEAGTMVTECIEEIMLEAEVNKPEEFFWVGWVFRQKLSSLQRERLFWPLKETDPETSEEDME